MYIDICIFTRFCRKFS